MTKTTTRVGASIAALALATGAALAGAAPASAATTVGDVTWYGATDLGAESGGYPTNDWFTGAIGGGFTAATPGFTAEGLTVTTGATEKFQILTNLAASTPASAADFGTFVQSMNVLSPDTAWAFQLPLFGDGTGQFTTLRPDTLGVQPTGATTWITSGAIFADDGTTVLYPAGATGSLADFATALYGTTTPPAILAAGAFVDPSSSSTITGFFIGDQYSAFTPVVTRTLTPNPVTPAQATTTGIHVQGTGWLPGSDLYIAIYNCDPASTDGPLYLNETAAVAAADGSVDFTVVLPVAPALGTYCVDVDDNDLFFDLDGMPPLELTVANVLPATGLEVTAPIVGGIAFLVIGGLALAVTRKVERNTNA